MKTEQKNWNDIYEKHGETLPWCLEEVPEFFKSVVANKLVTPCRTLEIACGLGIYANYLSENGFSVIATDISDKAINIARTKYPRQDIEFKVLNAFSLNRIPETFDFIYEMNLLHHIPQMKRQVYLGQIDQLLNKNGKVMMCFFTDKDAQFLKINGRYISNLGLEIYPLSRQEIDELFLPFFDIDKVEKVYYGKRNGRQKERWFCQMIKKCRNTT